MCAVADVVFDVVFAVTAACHPFSLAKCDRQFDMISAGVTS